MRGITALSGLVLVVVSVFAQPVPFDSKSTGTDGDLNYAANQGTVYFPPVALGLRPNNIYNFKSITIGAGTTVRVSGWVINGPVYWLAQGDVNIAGTLDLSGQIGHPPNNPSARAPSEPGAGGYSGGVGHLGNGQNATTGFGPGGGALPGFDMSNPDAGGGGTYSGSTYLQPLIGGSGGGGGCRAATNNSCAGGGAGGGAILIASSTKITLQTGGIISALGGDGRSNYGGGGSGGAIRLVSNTISSSGYIEVCGGGRGSGSGNGSYGGGGVARAEASSISGINLSGPTCNGFQGTLYTSIPYAVAPPAGGPSLVSVTSVNGQNISANPFIFPDATVTTGSPVPVIISGANVPPSTTGNLYIFSETSPDQAFAFTLSGTLQNTSATISVPYPAGGSRGLAKATWTSQSQQPVKR